MKGSIIFQWLLALCAAVGQVLECRPVVWLFGSKGLPRITRCKHIGVSMVYLGGAVFNGGVSVVTNNPYSKWAVLVCSVLGVFAFWQGRREWRKDRAARVRRTLDRSNRQPGEVVL